MKNSKKLFTPCKGKLTKISDGDFTKLKKGSTINQQWNIGDSIVLMPYKFWKFQNNQLWILDIFGNPEKVDKTEFCSIK